MSVNNALWKNKRIKQSGKLNSNKTYKASDKKSYN